MDNVISLSGINKIYGSEIKTQVLFDINLDIQAQSFSSIIGASGSGKSTLLNIISTLTVQPAAALSSTADKQQR